MSTAQQAAPSKKVHQLSFDVIFFDLFDRRPLYDKLNQMTVVQRDAYIELDQRLKS